MGLQAQTLKLWKEIADFRRSQRDRLSACSRRLSQAAASRLLVAWHAWTSRQLQLRHAMPQEDQTQFAHCTLHAFIVLTLSGTASLHMGSPCRLVANAVQLYVMLPTLCMGITFFDLKQAVRLQHGLANSMPGADQDGIPAVCCTLSCNMEFWCLQGNCRPLPSHHEAADANACICSLAQLCILQGMLI